MQQVLLKSPMNYIGNKYKVIDQLLPLFPSCRTMVDLFAGGLDVAINHDAEVVYCNDVNKYLIGIYKTFQQLGYEEIVTQLKLRITEFSLSKSNENGYIALRNYYNSSTRDPIDLYLLITFGFNYQLRFNSKHEFNNPFGKNRSSFNDSLRIRLEPFIDRISDYIFSSDDFRDFDYSILQAGDFVYCDPPYTISTGSYNDGKRGFNGWSEADDTDLMDILDALDNRGVKFALSNVVEHKGATNVQLLEWSKRYVVHDILCKYDNCNYRATNKSFLTREVLITNE